MYFISQVFRRTFAPALAFAGLALPGFSQTVTPSSQPMPAAPIDLPSAPSAVQRPLAQPFVMAGGVQIQPAQAGAMPLTLNAAVQAALKGNTEIILRNQQELGVRGQILTVVNALLPTLSATAYSQAQEINLAATGFKPSTLSRISIPGFDPSTFKTIVKINTTDAQINLSQTLTLPALYLYRSAQKASRATQIETLNSRGGVVLAVGGLYLRTLADQAQLRNAEALVRQDQVDFDHARARRDAGVGINLDVIRAQVQLQGEQQEVIRDRAAVEKDKILLNREMGQSAGQELDLADSIPFAELEELSLEDAKALAAQHRKDLLSQQVQLDSALEVGKAIKYEYLPSVGFNGFYGVLGETTGLYHGVFTAEGKVQFPIFQEATFRGQRETSAAQIVGLRHQIASTLGQIEADIRSSMLDVQSSRQLVSVARSNQALATEALGDATARFNAGVDDSLPLVRAQSALVSAQTRLVQAEFQYNFAKLQLARNTGVVETEYNHYLGR